MMEWDSATSSLNDMLRDELLVNWAQDARRCWREHSANAERFAAHGNFQMAAIEQRAANGYLHAAAQWEKELAQGGQS